MVVAVDQYMQNRQGVQFFVTQLEELGVAETNFGLRVGKISVLYRVAENRAPRSKAA
jgi:hypothetical protein